MSALLSLLLLCLPFSPGFADRAAKKVDLARATGLATTSFIERCYELGREARQTQEACP